MDFEEPFTAGALLPAIRTRHNHERISKVLIQCMNTEEILRMLRTQMNKKLPCAGDGTTKTASGLLQLDFSPRPSLEVITE